jgi:outer membrane receptor protein involved in Fe transport
MPRRWFIRSRGSARDLVRNFAHGSAHYFTRACIGVCVTAALAWPAPAHAQRTSGADSATAPSSTSPSSTSARPDSAARDSARARSGSATVLSATVITATRELQSRTATSTTIDAVSAAEIARTRPSHPAQLLNRVAGVHVSELSAEGHSTAIRQPLTTKPMYLYLEDGVPTRATGFFNHNGLYEVNLPQSGGIEVLKGPGTALYGSDAIGGIVNVLTRPAPARPTVEASLESGGAGYARFLGTGGFRNASNGLRLDLNLTRSNGWQDDSPYHRASGTVRWDAYTASGWSARTVATGTSVDQHDVLPLPRSLFAAGSSANLAPFATRGVRALRASTAIEQENGTSLFSVTPYVRHDVLNVVPYWQLSYDPQVWDTRNNSAGVLLKYRRDVEPLQTRFIVGADADYSPGSFFAQRAVISTSGGSGGVPRSYTGYTTGATQYDYDVTYRSMSPYVHAEWTPSPRLRIDGGARYDLSGYTYQTRLAAMDTGAHRVPPATSVSYAHVSPKLGLTYDLTPSVNVYASYRHGFRAPAQSQLFQQNSAANTVGLKPVSANSAEVGLRGAFGDRFVYELDAYDMRISNDIITYVTPRNTREASNAGHTRHRGVEASAGVVVTPTLRVDASYSISSQRYVEWTPSATVSFAGNRIEQAPRDLSNVLVSYSPSTLRGGRVALEVVSVGRYAMDPQNTHYYSGYQLANVMLDYPVTPRAGLFARIANITNRNYAEVAAYDAFQKEQFTRAAPRMAYVGARMTWSR